MKKKHLVASALALGIIGGAVAVPNAIFADSDAVTSSANTSTYGTKDELKTPGNHDVKTPGNHDVGLFKTKDLFNVVLDGKSPLTEFSISPGYGHVKLRVKNNTKATLTFTLRHVNSGDYLLTKYVGAGEPFTWYSTDSFSNGMRAGDYEIQWRAGGAYVDATAWGISATSSDEL
ncbi:hypothetical protein NLX78_14575 [Paenibacillus sp. Lou8.1]|uniref:hypothetical protein n=1 Tax=Paenibacillus sp. Lou8.1 TaxID=2962041 RepID=UPI0020B8E87F|nr:hypothetical protein [Paenibacillus sp. Lou8.1]MCP3808461.1 hypothetical protein [Paenibacillus sp. Lou8.1]